MNKKTGRILRVAVSVLFLPVIILFFILTTSFFGQHDSSSEKSPDSETGTVDAQAVLPGSVQAFESEQLPYIHESNFSPESYAPAEAEPSSATASIGIEIPDKYTAVCPDEGSIQRLNYNVSILTSPGTVIERPAAVYLPFGYSEDTEYDTVWLLHGMGDDENAWLSTGDNFNVVNNLIYYGDIKPVIIVCPTILYPDWLGFYQEYSNVNYSQFEYELRNVLIPLVESSFSCYSGESAREHRALAGLSMGSAITVNVGIERMLDLFSSFGTFSGTWANAEDISSAIHSPEFEEYSIDCLFASNGEPDFTFSEHTAVFRELESSDAKITAGENYTFIDIPYGNHSWPQWSVSLYDFLQLIFK